MECEYAPVPPAIAACSVRARSTTSGLNICARARRQ